MNFLLLILTFFVFLSSHANEDIKSDNLIKDIIKEYLLQNPEVIIESLERYRNNQEIEMEENKKATLNSYYDNKKYEVLPFTGNNKGKIIVTEFIDYNCGYCKKTLLTINKLLEKYKDVKVVFVDFPILSETSYSAAKAAVAASKQNAYFQFHSELLNNRKDINESYLLELAKSFNLDLIKFKKDMESDETKNLIDDNIKLARDLNIRGTPTFIIDKIIYPGAYSIEKLEEILNKI